MKYEEKFIVLNKKRFDEILEANELGKAVIESLLLELDNFEKRYEYYTSKSLDQKYYVVNQDEPYADKVWEIIKDHEK